MSIDCIKPKTFDEYHEKEMKELWEKFENIKRKPTSTGWICPSCGKVNAPWKGECDCCYPVYTPTIPYYPWPYYGEPYIVTYWSGSVG